MRASRLAEGRRRTTEGVESASHILPSSVVLDRRRGTAFPVFPDQASMPPAPANRKTFHANLRKSPSKFRQSTAEYRSLQRVARGLQRELNTGQTVPKEGAM